MMAPDADMIIIYIPMICLHLFDWSLSLKLLVSWLWSGVNPLSLTNNTIDECFDIQNY